MTEEEKAKLRFVGVAKGTSCIGNLCEECIYNSGRYAIFGEKPNICPFEKNNNCIDHKPYYFFKQKDERTVVVFSKFRVPFDLPKSNVEIIKQLKSDLIKEIKNLQPFDNCILQARYGTTEKKSFYDVENVLFYNIGTTHFKPFTKQGVTFSVVDEQEIDKLRKKWKIPVEYTHYYEYQLTATKNENSFTDLLAQFENIPLKCLGLKPANSWKTIKNEESKIQVYDKIDCEKKDTFALVLNIEKPKDVQFNIMTAMKPLLDGLICAFHSSQFSEDELEYFSKILNCKKEILNSASINVLGERTSRYIQIYRNNVKWNPADDLCNYVYISISNGTSWSLSGKIYSTIKCPKCGKQKLSKLIWGMPSFDEKIAEAEELGKIKFAGCVAGKIKPRYYCRWCKKQF